MDPDFILEIADDTMTKSIDHLEAELMKIRAGKANPSMLSGVKVEYYGALTPLNQVGHVTAPDGRTLTISPYEKSVMDDIERAIINANLGLNPQNNGDIIIINIPALTEERRLQLSKQVKAVGEDAKVSIRNARREANDELKKLEKDKEISEDLLKRYEADVQKATDNYTKKVDDFVAAKEHDIMTV